jgi:hypothetical protein
MRTVERDNVIMTHDSGSPREQMIPFWETTAAAPTWPNPPSSAMACITKGAARRADETCVNVMGDAAIGMTVWISRLRAQPHRDPHCRVQQRRWAPSATC